MYFSILSPKQKKLLKEVAFLSKYGFYLAGGTALALQIGHRTSLDFDFYTKEKFNNKKTLTEFETRFQEVKLIQIPEQTLIIKVNGVEVSFFHYPYDLVFPLVRKKETLSLASKEDIAAMKLISIIQRGTRRDFVDIFFLIKEFGLGEILEWAKQKYPSFNIYLALQALTYFHDAEKEKEDRRISYLKPVKWANVKKYLIRKVADFKKIYLENP